jgi:hypothetical protein
MKRFARLAAGALALTLVATAGAASAGSLTTDFTTINYGRSGLYFDLTATNALTITDFVVNGGAGDWSVWYKEGTFAGFETDPGAWTLMGSDSTASTIDTLNIGGLHIGAGDTFGIYVFDYSSYQYYNDGSATYSNADLTFNGGTGNYGEAMGLGPFNNTLADRVWSGTVDYQLGGGAPEPATWALMIGGMGLAGAAIRRRRAASAA